MKELRDIIIVAAEYLPMKFLSVPRPKLNIVLVCILPLH